MAFERHIDPYPKGGDPPVGRSTGVPPGVAFAPRLMFFDLQQGASSNRRQGLMSMSLRPFLTREKLEVECNQWEKLEVYDIGFMELLGSKGQH